MRARVSIGLLVAVAVAAAVWLPVHPVYATSDSMAPAIETGDLYFVVEDAPIRPNDAITYESTGHPGLVTHRVVGETAAGYVTKGDANPTIDQAAGQPVVARSSVMGRVVEVNGRPVTIPGAGTLYGTIATNQLSLMTVVTLLVAALLFGTLRSTEAVPGRDVVYVRDVVRPMFVGGLLVSLLFVLWGASSHDLTYVASQGDVTAAHTVPVGEAVTRTVTVETRQLPFTTVLLEADGVDVLERTTTTAGAELVVEVSAQERPGTYGATVAVSTYPATLPRGVIERLHGFHWLAATLGTIAPVHLPLYGLYLGFLDGRVPLRWPADRWLKRARWY